MAKAARGTIGDFMSEPREPDRVENARRYHVRVADYCGRPGAEGSFGKLVAVCEAPIKQLIARYELAGKSVLSIGAGEGFEEIWFARAGCPLTLLDINESIGALCASLPPAATGDRASLTYIIADAGEYVTQSRERFDVLYVSSFHPDEIRREEMQRAARRWPTGQDPYHPVLMKAASLLKPGGLAIFQHYRGGVNVAIRPSYLDDLRRQFARHGLSPLEVYTFRRSAEHLLVIATYAQGWAGSLFERPPITEFHGRYPGDERKHVLQVFAASGLPAQARARLLAWRCTMIFRWLSEACRRRAFSLMSPVR